MYEGESKRSCVKVWCEPPGELKSPKELGLPECESKTYPVSGQLTSPAPTPKARPTPVTLPLPSNLGLVCKSILVK